jgi:hypothetical protein
MAASDNLIHKSAEDPMHEMAVDLASPNRPATRRRPLSGVYVALLLFVSVYFARPEDWIPGLSNVPIAKIMAIAALLALLFSLRHMRQRLAWEVIFLALLVAQLVLASLMSPVSRGNALEVTLDFSKIILVVLLIAAAVSTVRRLRALIFTFRLRRSHRWLSGKGI